MALSLLRRFAVCLSVVALITILQQFHLQNSFFTYGNPDGDIESIGDNRSCPVKIRCDGIELINIGITMMYPEIKIKGRYHDALKEFYDKMKNDSTAFEKITSYLEKEFNETGILIQQGEEKFNNTEYENNFQALLIYLYTTKSNKSIYYNLNKSLRNHAEQCNNKTMTTEDKNIAPYAAALTAILYNWESLKSTSDTTYRGINRNISEGNNSVVWTSFTSSSLSKSQAESYGNLTFYTITNKNVTDRTWQPKLISNFSATPDEQEALYPPGSVFEIVEKCDNGTYISYNISLIDQSNDDECVTTSQKVTGHYSSSNNPVATTSQKVKAVHSNPTFQHDSQHSGAKDIIVKKQTEKEELR